MKKNTHGGPGRGQGRHPLPNYIKKVRAGNLRLTWYKIEELKTLPVSLGSAIETALDKEYRELFESFLREFKKNNEETGE